MQWNDHSRYEGLHAILSASKSTWVRKSPEAFLESLKAHRAALEGTRKHAFAAECIRMGRTITGRDTLATYIKDAIGFRMRPEQMLFVSPEAFGTADAISYNRRTLRIHDLKTGTSPGDPTQLEVYAAFFCIEYEMNPKNINIVNRIYQCDEVAEFTPDAEKIEEIMAKTKEFVKLIRETEDPWVTL